MAWLLVCVFSVCACGARGPKTAQAAAEALATATSRGDAEALYEALDQHTRWSWMTIQKSHREAYDVVLSNFPEGADKEQKLKALDTAATAETAADLFAAKMGARALAELKQRLPTGPLAVTVSGDTATAPALAGPPLTFAQVEKRWGYSGFRGEAEELKRRAIADLEMIKLSATDYERARTLGTP